MPVKKKSAPKKDKFGPNELPPNEVFVQFNNEAKPDERWLLAEQTLDGAYSQSQNDGGDGLGLIGVYRLVRVVRVKRETKFIETPVK